MALVNVNMVAHGKINSRLSPAGPKVVDYSWHGLLLARDTGTQAIAFWPPPHLHHGAAQEDVHHSAGPTRIIKDTQMSLSDAVIATQDRPSWRSLVRDATRPATQAT